MKKTLNRIAVNKEAYLFLIERSRKERGCKPLSDQAKERMWARTRKNANGKRVLDDESLGGGDGTYYGKWTSWTCEDLKKLLTEGGHEWEDLGTVEVEYMNIYI